MNYDLWYEDYPEPWNHSEALALIYDAERALEARTFTKNVLDRHAPYGTYLIEHSGYRIEVIRKEPSHNGIADPLDRLRTVGLKAKWGPHESG